MSLDERPVQFKQVRARPVLREARASSVQVVVRRLAVLSLKDRVDLRREVTAKRSDAVDFPSKKDSFTVVERVAVAAVLFTAGVVLVTAEEEEVVPSRTVVVGIPVAPPTFIRFNKK